VLNKETTTEQVNPVAKSFNLFGNKALINRSSESISIKRSAQQTADNKAAAEQAVEVREEATRLYTIEEIRLAWRNFAEQKLQANLQVKTVFNVAEIALIDNQTLRVSFPSATQTMYFNDHRGLLGDYLRNQYDIRGLDFQVDILKQEDIKQTYKTEKQRYEEMVQKNPALETLRKRFGLQVDF
jgi:DNA polymerase-3 subunit gamma/tau